MHPLQRQLCSLCTGKVLLMGVGNRMRGDDGAGPLLVDTVKGRCRIECIDAGVAPENFLEKAVRAGPDTVLIADAISFKGSPGEIRVMEGNALSSGSISTHALSLAMVCEYITKRSTGTRIALIGINPQTVSLGADMSDAVARSVKKLAEELVKACGG
ncbi:MAG: hydrogenase 3 maturation endopeptidase HyCI [Chitinispirillaceae bacterium]|nr:hydrogenase 3 maturation endopeptidase HyCI [Chitinispirillaceae bacterium]